MKRLLIALVALIALVSSCTFDFFDDAKDIAETDTLHSVTQTTENVQVTKWYDTSETLQYSEEGYIQSGSRQIEQVQKYSASGELKHTYRYIYNAAAQIDLVAYYDSSDSLQWFHVYTFDENDRISVQAEYNGSAILQWARKYTYVPSSETASGEISTVSSFTSLAQLDGVAVYSFLTGSKKWNKEVSYGTIGNVISDDPAICALIAEDVNVTSVTNHGRISVTMPNRPESLALTVPVDPSTVLSLTGYRFAYYDDYGNSKISLNPSWYPLSAVRDDSRLDGNDLQVDLTYDSANRIVNKTTYYGSTKALSVDIAYDSGNYPTTVTTTGAAMLLPLEYTMAYDEYRRPSKISVTSEGKRLHYFNFAYSGTPAALTITTDRSIDPFNFLDSLLSVEMTITHYDGDDDLVESFYAHAVTEGIQIDVIKPDGKANGLFLVTRDAAGRPVSFTTKNAKGKTLNVQEFSFADAQIDALSEATFGRLVEVFIPNDTSNGSSEIADNFKYDLFF